MSADPIYYRALATDYDGTIADHGGVDAATLASLEELKKSGRRLILVSGRELPDLQRSFDRLDLFDLAVLENGALLYEPSTRAETPLADPPSQVLFDRLQASGVTPLSAGRCIIATWSPHEHTVLKTIRELGLELQIIFNKGAVMVLPANVNKASGLKAALERLRLSPHNVVAVGDAENDHAFLSQCGVAVAVANAVPALKDTADLVTDGARGAGVAELAAAMIASDLDDPRAVHRRESFFATTLPTDGATEGEPVYLDPRAGATLVAGISGGGKSTIATTLLERFDQRRFQFCVIDPEGDYSEFAGAVVLGDAHRPPAFREVMELLETGMTNVVVNLLALDVGERPAFFAALLPEIQRLHLTTGRPHWMLIDEAHHMFPETWAHADEVAPKLLPATILITVHPAALAPEILKGVTTMLAVGSDPAKVLAEFAQATGLDVGRVPEDALESRQGYLWRRDGLRKVQVDPPKDRLRRHVRKYAEGDLGTDKSFYFRGADERLNIRAQNLAMFVQIGEGLDDETWLFHLHNGDYTRWVEESVKDSDLAKELRAVEGEADAATARAAVEEMIERFYTAPARG